MAAGPKPGGRLRASIERWGYIPVSKNSACSSAATPAANWHCHRNRGSFVCVRGSERRSGGGRTNEGTFLRGWLASPRKLVLLPWAIEIYDTGGGRLLEEGEAHVFMAAERSAILAER